MQHNPHFLYNKRIGMEQESVNQRLNMIVDTFERGVKAAFARKAGISTQGVQELLAGRKGAPSFKVLTKILESYPTVDANWLVLGRGPMLQAQAPITASETVGASTSALSSQQLQEVADRIFRLEMADDSLKTIREEARAKVEAEHLQRTYHLGKEATPGLSYDDRLTRRLVPFNEKEILTLLKRPEEKGGIRHVKEGDKYLVTEAALREWSGDAPKRSK
jgi:hypothetical protein